MKKNLLLTFLLLGACSSAPRKIDVGTIKEVKVDSTSTFGPIIVHLRRDWDARPDSTAIREAYYKEYKEKSP